MKITTMLHGAGALLCTMGLTAALAGCGSGLFESEDEELLPNMTVSGVALNGVASLTGETRSITVTVNNDLFSGEVAARSAGDDISEYFSFACTDTGGASDAVLASYSVALESVDNTPAAISGTGYTAAKGVLKATLEYKFAERAAASAGSVAVAVTGAAFASGSAYRSLASGSYTVAKWEDTYSMTAPDSTLELTALATIAAASLGGTNATANLQLSKGVLKSLDAGDQFASGTIGSTSVTLYAASHVKEGAGVIPMIVHADSTGTRLAGSLVVDFDAGVLDSAAVTGKNAGGASKLTSPSYGQDFTGLGVDDIKGTKKNDPNSVFVYNASVTVEVIEGDGTYGDYPQCKPSGPGNRFLASNFGFNLPSASVATPTVSYQIEFDLSMALGNVADRSQTQIAIGTGTPPDSDSKNDPVSAASTAFCADTGVAKSAAPDPVYEIEGADPVTIPAAAWCHYSFTVTETYAAGGVTYDATMRITNGTASVFDGKVDCHGHPTYLYFLLGRGSGVALVDNIFIRAFNVD